MSNGLITPSQSKALQIPLLSNNRTICHTQSTHFITMDEDMRQLAAAAVNKLQAMTDSEFSEREFILTDEE